jgi:hypothetical protein
VTTEGIRSPTATRRAAAPQDPGAAEDSETCYCRAEWKEPPSNLDHAPLAELSGRSLRAPEALDSSAPDTREMGVLFMFTWWISGPNRRDRRKLLLGRTDPEHGDRHRRPSKVLVPLDNRALRRVAVQPELAGTTA